MKIFCFNKVLLLLIYLLQLVLSDIPELKPFKPFISAKFSDELIVEKPEKKYQIKKKDFKPFVSDAPFSMTQLKDDDQNYTKIEFAVKCMFIDNFNLYNIAGLGKNALDEKVPEKGYEYENGTSTLIYNFCYDLKSSKTCP